MAWSTWLAYGTGLGLLNPEMEPAVLVRTVLLVHTCDSVMCRLFAHNNGYPKNVWTVLGLVFGIWAMAVLIVLPRRDTRAGTAPTAPPAQSSAIT